MRRLSGALALLLLVLTLASGPARAQLFSVPMTYCVFNDAEVAGIPPALQTFADDLRANPAIGGYEWAFPWIYTRTNREIQRRLAAGTTFTDPGLMNDEMAQFYEIYAVNMVRRFGSGGEESQWAFAKDVSNLLHGGASTPADTNTKALMAVMAAVYAHIIVDLPRALYILKLTEAPQPTLSQLRDDFWNTNDVFPPVTQQVLGISQITPEVLQIVYNVLPAILQRMMTGTIGMNALVIAAREVAWARIVKWAGQENWFVPGTDHRPEILAFTACPRLTPLPRLGARASAGGRGVGAAAAGAGGGGLFGQDE